MSADAAPKDGPKKAEVLRTWDLVFPNDANPYGAMFGGHLMALMDKVGALAAADFAGRIVTTASVEAMDFKSPIRVGDRIEIAARVVRVGTTSMVAKVDAYSDNPLTHARKHCTTAHFIYVALDERGRPTQVPPLRVESREETRAWEVAGRIQALARERRDHAADTEGPEGGA